MWTSTRAKNSSGSTFARRRAVGLVRPIGHDLGGPVVREPLQRDGIPRAVARESGRERAVVLRDPDGRVHVESGVQPGQHAHGLVFVEERKAHEQPEHGAVERLRQPRRVVHRPRDEGPVGPEPAVRDEQVQVRMPVRA